MIFAPLRRIEKFRNLFLLVFLILVVTIIFTPLFVKRGFSLFEEETLEAILLFVQVSLAWNIFRLYERAVARREEEIKKLEGEYQKREKQLLETFAYLGKLNVQISLVKSFLQKLKIPTSKKEAKEYMDEILHVARTISAKNWMTLRVIDTKNLQTVSEHWVRASERTKIGDFKIGNREILEIVEKKEMCNEKRYCVLPSESAGLHDEKAFLIFLEDKEVDREVLDFLRAAVNQCGIIYSMLSLRNGRR